MHPRPGAPHSCVVMIAPAALFRTLLLRAGFTSRAALFLEIRDSGRVSAATALWRGTRLDVSSAVEAT
jgi:hypothetical protein